MKRYRRMLAGLGAVLLFLGAALGCGGNRKAETGGGGESSAPVTAESLVESAKGLLEEASSVSGTMSLEMSMDYSAGGVEATLEMGLTQETELTREPEAAHMKGNLTVNLSDISLDTETYVVKDGDQYVTYSGSGGQWLMGTSQFGTAEADAARTLELLLEDRDSLELSGPDDSGIYQVTGQVSGESLEQLTASVGNLMELEDGGALTAQAVLSIDGESGELRSMSLDFTESYNALIQQQKESLGFDEVTVTAFSITMSGYERNGIEAITVPDEVLSSAVDINGGQEETTAAPSESADPEEPSSQDYEISQDEEGNYVLGMEQYGETLDIGTPAGFSYHEGSDKTWLQFDSQDNDGVHTMSLVYTLYITGDSYGEEDLAQSQESSYAFMTASPDYAEVSYEPVQTVTAAGKDVSYTRLSYLYEGTYYEEYNSWCVYDDGRMLQCSIREESAGEPCSRIDPSVIFETAFSAPKE